MSDTKKARMMQTKQVRFALPKEQEEDELDPELREAIRQEVALDRQIANLKREIHTWETTHCPPRVVCNEIIANGPKKGYLCARKEPCRYHDYVKNM